MVLGAEGDGGVEEDLRPEKVVGETGLLLLAVSEATATSVGIRERQEHLARLLVPYARSDRVATGMCVEPTLAREFAIAHAVLSRLGFPDAEFDRLFAAAVASRTAQARERVAHRQLEQEWLARVWNPGPVSVLSSPGLVARSILGQPLDALAAHRDDVYAFTHALMFHTDLGTRKARVPRPASMIAADAEAALAWCLDNQDYDLAGELLLTWPLLARRWSAPAAFGFSVLAQVEDEVGFLPALGIDLERYGSLRGKVRTRYALASAYHTAYVMGILCATALRPRCAPPFRVRAAQDHRDAAEAFPEIGNRDGAGPRWWTSFNELAPRQRDALAPMLVAVAVRRAVVRKDVGELHSVLRRAASHDLLGGPVPTQASEFLMRAQALGTLLAREPATPARTAGLPAASGSSPDKAPRLGCSEALI